MSTKSWAVWMTPLVKTFCLRTKGIPRSFAAILGSLYAKKDLSQTTTFNLMFEVKYSEGEILRGRQYTSIFWFEERVKNKYPVNFTQIQLYIIDWIKVKICKLLLENVYCSK